MIGRDELGGCPRVPVGTRADALRALGVDPDAADSTSIDRAHAIVEDAWRVGAELPPHAPLFVADGWLDGFLCAMRITSGSR